jgi:hypothetical protein
MASALPARIRRVGDRVGDVATASVTVRIDLDPPTTS